MGLKIAGVALLLAGAAPLAARAQLVAYTNYGVLQGEADPQGGTKYLGIRYAQPPVGALRFYPPQPPSFVGGVTPATAFGSGCPQGSSQFGAPSTDEDCLFLNIYLPSNATVQPGSAPLATRSNLPVMVWIHGGAFITGEGSDYDGTPLSQTGDVIVVTLNYRLGILGFLADAALAATDPNGSSGNYGLQDQQAALNWVKQNIQYFGGNPANMTIFGESAGGASVEFQLTSPVNTNPAAILGVPKLHSAIIESGAYSQSLPTLASAEAAGAKTAANVLGCTQTTNAAVAACLRAIPAASIVNNPAISPLNLTVSPNVDGFTLKQEPILAYASGAFQHVPVINGSNHDEYRLFVGLDDFVGGGPLTTASYTAMVSALGGGALLAEYPIANYTGPSFPCTAGHECAPDYAYSALVTDYSFACGAHLLNGLMAQYTPVYSYELNDPAAPDEFLPFDPNMPDLGDSHASELPYLWPDLTDPLLGIGPVKFSQQQLYLASTMRSFWTSLAKYGRPLAPRSGVWVPYGAQQLVLSLKPPAPALESTFVAEHNCEFWKSTLLTQAGLPPTAPY